MIDVENTNIFEITDDDIRTLKYEQGAFLLGRIIDVLDRALKEKNKEKEIFLLEKADVVKKHCDDLLGISDNKDNITDGIQVNTIDNNKIV